MWCGGGTKCEDARTRRITACHKLHRCIAPAVLRGAVVLFIDGSAVHVALPLRGVLGPSTSFCWIWD